MRRLLLIAVQVCVLGLTACSSQPSPHAIKREETRNFWLLNCSANGPRPTADQEEQADAVAMRHPVWSKGCATHVINHYESTIAHVEIATKNAFVGSSGIFDVLIFRDIGVPAVEGAATNASSALVYRAVLTDLDTNDVLQVIDKRSIWAETATQGTSSATGTDFRVTETSDPKTLLHVYANVRCTQWDWECFNLWQHRRLHVIGFDSVSGAPVLAGSMPTVIANKMLAGTIAVILCVLAYLVAAAATYAAHKLQRHYGEDGLAIQRPSRKDPDANDGAENADANGRRRVKPRSWWNPSMSRKQSVRYTTMTSHGYLRGTNYQSFFRHFDPVVLTAGANGLGSATNLQILFFSLTVFGVVTYIWMTAGYLTGLSSTVVLLMGISGIGATAASGAEMKTSRLSFESWAWLIERHWLPPGGIAEVNVAQWKDIFTTGGSFDVYRFQMICFSFVVGLSLISVGAEAADLSAFTVPEALLGILGLSQVVYVAGKLVAPPSIAELDEQVTELEKAEKDLRDANAQARAGVADPTKISWLPEPCLVAAQKALIDYSVLWEKTRIMFEATIGRLLPDQAVQEHPPFELSDVVRSRLPDAYVQTAYKQTLTLLNAPAATYQWKIESGTWPMAMQLDNRSSATAAVITVPASSLTQPATYKFALRTYDPASNSSVLRDFELNVVESLSGGLPPQTQPVVADTTTSPPPVSTNTTMSAPPVI